MSDENLALLRFRLKILTTSILLVMSIYSLRLFSLQIIHGKQFGTRAKNISQKITRLPSQRGEIYDRTGINPLVLNVDSFAVEVTPGQVPREKYSTIIGQLSQVLDVPISGLEKKLPISVKNDFRAIEVA